MSSKHPTRLKRHERRKLRNSKAAQAARERKHSLPWQRFVVDVRQHVDRREAPPGCLRIAEAMARCHQDHGAPVRDQELLLGYGWLGDPERTEARKRSRAEPPVFEGIANEAQLSRRWAIACVQKLVALGRLRRWFGGPNEDYRQNAREGHLQRAHPKTGERHEYVQGVGGAGWANAYTVEGIPDPVPPEDDPPPPRPGPPPEPERPSERPAAWVSLRQRHEAERLDKLRRRLAEPRGP